jgi:hypothetical protein
MHTSTTKPSLLTKIAAIAAVMAMLSSAPAQSAGSSTQEGCMSQWMFNGVWRVKATKVEPFMDGSQQVGWQVTESWRNGTSQEMAPGDSLLKDEVLELEDGSSIAASANNSGTMSMGVIASHGLAQAAQFTYVQVFRSATLNPAVKPKAVNILFDGDRMPQFKSRPQFTTHKYNYRIKLDCQSGGGQTAQGGAFEIPAVQGCMKQWMSNGLWRVRATAIAAVGDPGAPQIGWKLTEEWTYLAHQPIAAGDTNISVQQLVLGNGDTLESDAGVTSTGSFVQLATHTFAPGSSFTYDQKFIQIPFDTVDKPVKLIVTFDAATEKKITYRPQYKVNPPNFRINLECTK